MVDIIIPFDSTLNDLKKTISSIALQKIRDLIKVYVIDDSVNKSCKEICDIFKDDLDITIHKNKEKLGLGLSRQKGLDISKSKYVMFIDPGDLFYNPFSVNELYITIDNKNLDVVYGKYFNVTEEEKEEVIFNDNNLVAKIYKREYLLKNNICFIDDKYYSDYVFNHEVILGTSNIDSFDSFIVAHCDKNNIISDQYKIVNNYILSINKLISNMEKNKYNKENISIVITNSISYLYLLYAYNIEDKKVNNIIDKSKYIYDKFIGYRDCYTYNDIYKYILSIDAIGNLPILFGEFLSLYSK